MTEIKTGDFVIPGDPLATAEEFVPGDGAYEDGGKIYSASTGVVLIDPRKKHISVFSRAQGPPIPKRGDIIVGRVEEVREQFAEVLIGFLHGQKARGLPLPNSGKVHISQVRTGYVKDLSRQFRLGDIVRARVLDVGRDSIKLTTAGDELGVIVAMCPRCRTLLEQEDKKLRCPSCGSIELRKLANDYRQGVL